MRSVYGLRCTSAVQACRSVHNGDHAIEFFRSETAWRRLLPAVQCTCRSKALLPNFVVRSLPSSPNVCSMMMLGTATLPDCNPEAVSGSPCVFRQPLYTLLPWQLSSQAGAPSVHCWLEDCHQLLPLCSSTCICEHFTACCRNGQLSKEGQYAGDTVP